MGYLATRGIRPHTHMPVCADALTQHLRFWGPSPSSQDPTQGAQTQMPSILLALCDSPRLCIVTAGLSSQQASAQVGCGQSPQEMHGTQTCKLTLQERATTLLTCWPSQGDRNKAPLTTLAQLEGRPSAGPAEPTERPQALKVSECHQLYPLPNG